MYTRVNYRVFEFTTIFILMSFVSSFNCSFKKLFKVIILLFPSVKTQHTGKPNFFPTTQHSPVMSRKDTEGELREQMQLSNDPDLLFNEEISDTRCDIKLTLQSVFKIKVFFEGYTKEPNRRLILQASCMLTCS